MEHFTPPQSERGAALLTVLLLVAVMATIAATAMDRLGVGIRLAGNSASLTQGRAWLGTAELLAMTRIEDLLAADRAQTLGGGWMGKPRTITLPDGGVVQASVDDGGNCFNLNSLVESRGPELVGRPQASRQFVALMGSLGIAGGEGEGIAAAATDYIDSDSESAAAPNRPMIDVSELRATGRITPRAYRLIERWVCALPTTDLSPINVNTLLPEQAPLLAMLAPGVIDPARARAQLATRPAGGFGSVMQFWNSPALRGLAVPPEAAQQVQVRTGFFRLKASVRSADAELAEIALIDARTMPAQIVWRAWETAS